MVWNSFQTVHNYSQMLNKISLYTFLFSLLAFYILSKQIEPIHDFLFQYPTKIEVYSIPLPLGLFLAAFAVAFIARIIKLHDRVSDCLGIRRRFDVKYIIMVMADSLGVSLSKAQTARLKIARDRIMRDVFYRYASSTESRAHIDPHDVTMAMDQWAWFWIIVEAQTVIILSAIVLLFAKKMFVVFILVVISVPISAVLLIYIWRKCKEYAQIEIQQILDDDTRKREIRDKINAI